MKETLHLRIASTFPCTALKPSLERTLGDAGVAHDVGFVRFTQLSEYLLASPPSSTGVAGTVVLLRLEDWLREQLESAAYDAARDGWIRQEFRLRVEQFVNQLGILARSGNPVWLLACVSNGWISEKHKLAGLCRTFTNLVVARVRDLPQTNILSWPAALSGTDFVDREADQMVQGPFTPDTFEQLGAFLGAQVARWVSSQDPDAVSHASGGSSELAEYLAGLRVQVELLPADSNHREHADKIIRTAASFTLMGEKPNISEREVDALLNSGACMLVDVTDRISEYGPSGVVLFRSTDDALVVSVMALSCPVLGKQVEFAVLSTLSQIAAERGLTKLVFEFRPSARNQPILAFLTAAGMEETPRGYVLPTDEVESRVKKVAAAPGAWKVNMAALESKETS
jgi:hypothetical protein